MSQPIAINPTNYEGINLAQELLVKKFNTYLKIKRAKIANPNKELERKLKTNCVLPFDAQRGLCAGLVSYWLYMKRIGQESEFIKQLNYLLVDWDSINFENSPLLEDPRIEALLNILALLSFDVYLRHNEKVKQDDIAASMNLIRSEFHPEMQAAEFTITFVFDRQALAKLMSQLVVENKMVRFGNGFHTVGMIKVGAQYIVNNPNEKSPTIHTSAELAADHLFDALAAWCKSHHYIAIHMNISDLASATAAEYPDPIAYCRALLSNPAYAKNVITHRNIFHLGMRYNSYAMLDLLYEHGYKYIPWTASEDTEYVEAVTGNDYSDIDFLLQHGVPIDYKVHRGITPLGKAISYGNTEMLYRLLRANADPNIQAVRGFSPIKLALLLQRKEAIILLLAYGADITTNELEQLFNKFGSETDTIIQRSIDLNKEILNVPNVFQLVRSDGSKVDPKELIAFLYHAKLKYQLGFPVASVLCNVGNLTVIGESALNELAKLYFDPSYTISFTDRYMLRRLLGYFDVDLFDFNGTAELNDCLSEIRTKITSKPLAEYTVPELIELGVILNELTDIATPRLSLSISKACLGLQAYLTKRAIMTYLTKNGVTDLNDYIVAKKAIPSTRGTLLFYAHKDPEREDFSFQADITPFVAGLRG